MVPRSVVLSLAAAVALSAVVWGASFTVNTATATVAGRPAPILVDGDGNTLYYLTSDKPTTSACTGACASAWPPLLSTTAPAASPSAPGKLSTTNTANGSQVGYNGHLLYRYSGDSSPGQVNGNDRGGPAGGRWFVATPGLKESASEYNSGNDKGNDMGGGSGY